MDSILTRASRAVLRACIAVRAPCAALLCIPAAAATFGATPAPPCHIGDTQSAHFFALQHRRHLLANWRRMT